jgi:hypothetical protein
MDVRHVDLALWPLLLPPVSNGIRLKTEINEKTNTLLKP